VTQSDCEEKSDMAISSAHSVILRSYCATWESHFFIHFLYNFLRI